MIEEGEVAGSISTPELFEGERLASQEELTNFWTQDRLAAAETAYNTAQITASELGLEELPGFSVDNISLIVSEQLNPRQASGFDISGIRGGFAIQIGEDSEIDPETIAIVTSHEAHHSLVSDEFEAMKSEMADRGYDDVFYIFEEAVVERTAIRQLHAADPNLKPTPDTVAYTENERGEVFETPMDVLNLAIIAIAENNPDRYLSEDEVFQDFQRWVFAGTVDMRQMLVDTYSQVYSEVSSRDEVESALYTLVSGFDYVTNDALKEPANKARVRALSDFMDGVIPHDGLGVYTSSLEAD